MRAPDTGAEIASYIVGERPFVPPVIWEMGNIAQIRSLLVLREAELVATRAQLSGKNRIDWFTKNHILDLEIKIADLRRWLAEALKQRNVQEE